jgi:hypothetical protein
MLIKKLSLGSNCITFGKSQNTVCAKIFIYNVKKVMSFPFFAFESLDYSFSLGGERLDQSLNSGLHARKASALPV